MRVSLVKIGQYGFERGRITDFFVKVRVISLFRYDFGVLTLETLVKKRDMPNNTKTII